jgi:hypothetical protein
MFSILFLESLPNNEKRMRIWAMRQLGVNHRWTFYLAMKSWLNLRGLALGRGNTYKARSGMGTSGTPSVQKS